jgi:uncharacterized RDD family membrane protein YckC
MTTIDAALAEPDDTTQPAYARFSRRIRAVFIDWIVFIVMLFGALFAAVTVRADGFSRELGFGLTALLLLYEPVLVSLAGGTVGHILTNLRVVDDRTQGNIGFLKAVARFVIKTGLGWYSFITMATTRRHQAVHDLLTGSTVQIRNPAKASSADYVRERTGLYDPGMPSRGRRTLVIVAYALASFALMFIAVKALVLGGLVSRVCMFQDRCTFAESQMFNVIGLSWLGLSVLAIVLGWRGRLPGARVRQAA